MPRIPTADEIQQIVAAGTAERIDLEFKAKPWDRGDNGKREALKDITAMANTRGGLILIGIGEENNAAKDLAPLSEADAESERSRINDLIYGGVEPRLYGVIVEAVPIAGGAVLAIAIPRSPSRPHRVSTGGVNRFYLRNSTAVYEPNVMDLRNLFLQSAEIAERAERYHRDRLGPIRSGDIVDNMSTERGSIIMHIIPADAFSATTVVDPGRAYELQGKFRPIGVTDFTPRFTFDGFLNLRGGETCHGYRLVRRDGIVEAVKVGLASREDVLPAYVVEARIVRAAHLYAEGLMAAGVVPPLYAFVTLEGAGGRRVVYDTYQDDDGTAIPREDLHLPVAVIESAESKEVVGTAFRAAFDAMWNAGGFIRSISFPDGQWTQRAQAN